MRLETIGSPIESSWLLFRSVPLVQPDGRRHRLSVVAVPPGSVGVGLRQDDEIVLGEARLRIKFDGSRLVE